MIFWNWLRCKFRHRGYMGPGYVGLMAIRKITVCPVCGEDYAD